MIPDGTTFPGPNTAHRLGRALGVWLWLLAAVLLAAAPARAEESSRSLTISRDVAHGLRLAGETVRLQSRIAGDVAITAERAIVAPRAIIEGDLWILAENVAIEGRIEGDVEAAGGRVLFNGEADGDVRLSADAVAIGPDAVIHGRLSYLSLERADIAPGARIAGRVERLGGAAAELPLDDEDGGDGWGLLLLLFVVSTAATLFFPTGMRRVRRAAFREPLRALGSGLVALIGLPLLALLLAITVIGLPLAVLVLLLYLLALVLGVLTAIGIIGDGLLSLLRPDLAPGAVWRVLAVLIGAVLLWLLGQIPVLGPLIWVVAITFGMGGAIMAVYAGFDIGGPDVLDLAPERPHIATAP